MFMPMYDKESRQLVNKARTLGTGILSINLQDHELLRICTIVAADLDKQDLVSDVLNGLKPSKTLASWLVWRKWLYDIDNRSAQETGYLFEPILSAAIGGIPFAAKKSPIKRTNEPTKGRQVDCLDNKLAYEFKMRVTIAASGQGRFKEELDFAQDCFNSGYTPILLVLDPTPSTRLDELKAEYEKYQGDAYIGNDAWKHIEDKAGEVMGKFVEKYVKTPLKEVDETYHNLQPIHLTNADTAIMIWLGNEKFSISRTGMQIDYESSE